MARGRVIVDGGAPHPLGGGAQRITLGREPDNDIVINHPMVSRRHLAIEWRGTAWCLVDIGSTNGFFVNGRRMAEFMVPGTTQVRLGDVNTGPVVDLVVDVPASGGRPPSSGPGRSVPSRPGPPVSRPMQSGHPPSGPRSAGFPGAAVPASGQMPAHAPGGRQYRVDPMPREVLSAPHLQALQQNVSAVYRLPGAPTPERESISLRGVQRIGRTPDNDIVVSDVLASRHHAQVSSRGAALVIEDLGSVNGTFVNGRRVSSAQLTDGDVVTIGNSDFVVSGGTLMRGQESAAVADGLHVHGVSLVVDGGKRLLADVDFSASPGTLTAVIGPSGAGKSTVSKIAAGLNSPTSGLVTFESRNVHAEYDALRTRIGMVPQKDVLHHKLTLRQALRYAAELRLPPDLSKADRDRVIDGVLSELQLTEHVDTRVEKLSGGQQKRASVAMELLTGPSLLILDEPTSGLDPALDRQVMATLRRLADAGRVVLVVTHSLTYLSMCDQVLLLAPGGKTSFCGPPGQVEGEMGTSDWAEIFAYVADQPDTAHMRYLDRHRRAPNPPPPQRPPGPPIPVPHTSFTRQSSTIARRQVRLIFADVGYLVFLVLLPVVLGLLTLVIPGSSGFARLEVIPNAPPPKDGAEAIQILVVLVVGAAFMGAALTVRDLVGERDIFERERAVGLRPGAYLFAKIVVFFVAAVLQTIIMVGITFAGRGLPDFGGPILPPPLALLVAVAVLACVSTLVGLAISSAVKSNEQVMPPLVIVVMVQLVFCGGLFKLDGIGLEQLSWIFPSFWGYVAAAGSVDLYNINVAAPQRITLWETSVAHTALAYGVLAVISALLLAFTYSRLRLKKR
ncbi:MULTISPECIES: FHA domain-containing protein [unclassified Gordonia (in: high G+C Gram-positive bacteria)]|uniref:FHA domain-containing protein n=1 Tax=unclassified Gordonia (in: high G+C Gram-positive bacteria) TaxID=2657482 RepID=UPI00196261F0|nr:MULTISPECIES: FHA domain-containing protein [unclassified Gordonia (in: high G+C Gram-positive bacteria)]MBN0973998.1 FHA domain-containing protein [Gordonia sp. BP-119]MBN0984421.1 FHA domain-containing protein [Gordonia sp. BP-94]